MAEMDYCGPQGIEWEHFLGWSQTSRDAAILWHRRQRQSCTGCGTHPDDWDPVHGGHAVAFVASVVTCPGCAALEVRRERLTKDEEKGRSPRGTTVTLRRQVSQGAG